MVIIERDKPMEENNKEIKIISLQEALDMIDAIPQDSKNRFSDYLKIYDKYQKQKGMAPEDITALLAKGKSSFPEDENKLLIYVFSKIKTKSDTNLFIKAYILKRCIEKLRSIGYEIPEDAKSGDFYKILHKEQTEADSFYTCINDIQAKYLNTEDGKAKPDDIIPIVYMFLAMAVEDVYKYEPKRSEIMLDMERVFVEEALFLTDKDLREAVGHQIPQYLAKGRYKGVASLCYLYYDYKPQNQVLASEIDEQKQRIAKLCEIVEQQNGTINSLKISCSDLTEEKEQLTAELQQKITEKEAAEDRLEFETNRIERQYQSQNQGLSKKYNKTLGLEIDGIEDIIEYLPDNAKKAIKERIDRMRQIIQEIGG